MATKNSDDNNIESLDDYNLVQFVDNMTDYAVAHEGFRVMPLPSFDEGHCLGADLTQVGTGEDLSLNLPVEFRNRVAFVRVGTHEPSGVPVVIATTQDALTTLVTDGFAYSEQETPILPFSHGELQIEAYGGR
jgi:hypothetical protein